MHRRMVRLNPRRIGGGGFLNTYQSIGSPIHHAQHKMNVCSIKALIRARWAPTSSPARMKHSSASSNIFF